MSRVTIDLENIADKVTLHKTLKTHLGFPDYYGENFDAFWDSITRLVTLPDEIEFKGWANFQDQLPREAKLLKTCLDDYSQTPGRTPCSIRYS